MSKELSLRGALITWTLGSKGKGSGSSLSLLSFFFSVDTKKEQWLLEVWELTPDKVLIKSLRASL